MAPATEVFRETDTYPNGALLNRSLQLFDRRLIVQCLMAA